MDSLTALCQPLTSVVVRAMSRTQSWCSQMSSMKTWSRSRAAGVGAGAGACQHQEVRRLKARSSPLVEPGLAGAGGDPGDEQREVGGLLGCGPDRLRLLRPGAVLVATVVEALQAVHFQRCTPAVVRQDFFIAVWQIGHSLVRGERDLTRCTISPECQQPDRITGQNHNHSDFQLLLQRKVRSYAPCSRR